MKKILVLTMIIGILMMSCKKEYLMPTKNERYVKVFNDSKNWIIEAYIPNSVNYKRFVDLSLHLKKEPDIEYDITIRVFINENQTKKIIEISPRVGSIINWKIIGRK